MDIESKEDSSCVPIHNPEGIVGSVESQHETQTLSDKVKILAISFMASFPTLLLIGVGAKPSIVSICVYVSLLMSTSIFIRSEIQSGVARWFLGLGIIILTSGWKSGQLLAECDYMPMKGVIYAITGLWECSNAALIIGGKKLVNRYGIISFTNIMLYCAAPCQVKFVRNGEVGASRYFDESSSRLGKRTIHITLCLLGTLTLYYLLTIVQIRTFFTSFILLELEYMAFMASMAVVVLNIPSHIWQLIHNVLQMTPELKVEVILPYGWVYSSSSTREFWSRWSRPATLFIRHLFFYPLGGRERWYISIPVMFLLNASSHFDLSEALVGERSEGYWLALFGTLAIVAMLELCGDAFFGYSNDVGDAVVYPKFYRYAKAIIAHASLRLVLYIMVHLCLKTSLSDLVS